MLIEIKKAIEEYKNYYQKGLKHEANKKINEMVDHLRKISTIGLREQILYEFCEDICDKKDPYKLKSRGNGRIPYALDKILWEYLQEQCKKGHMPQLRWTYQLYLNNPFDQNFDAEAIIKQAFEHQKCDEKTERLYFNRFLSDLDWSSHHFPEGCIITHEQYEEIIKKCHDILSKRKISKEQIAELDYFQRLYQCYYKYVDSGRTLNFDQLCNETGIEFKPFICVYYEK